MHQSPLFSFFLFGPSRVSLKVARVFVFLFFVAPSVAGLLSTTTLSSLILPFFSALRSSCLSKAEERLAGEKERNPERGNFEVGKKQNNHQTTQKKGQHETKNKEKKTGVSYLFFSCQDVFFILFVCFLSKDLFRCWPSPSLRTATHFRVHIDR